MGHECMYRDADLSKWEDQYPDVTAAARQAMLGGSRDIDVARYYSPQQRVVVIPADNHTSSTLIGVGLLAMVVGLPFGILAPAMIDALAQSAGNNAAASAQSGTAYGLSCLGVAVGFLGCLAVLAGLVTRRRPMACVVDDAEAWAEDRIAMNRAIRAARCSNLAAGEVALLEEAPSENQAELRETLLGLDDARYAAKQQCSEEQRTRYNAAAGRLLQQAQTLARPRADRLDMILRDKQSKLGRLVAGPEPVDLRPSYEVAPTAWEQPPERNQGMPVAGE